MKIDWRAKLSSRKFWAAVGAWATSVLTAFNAPENTIAQSDSDWRRFASNTFVHQPKATINDYIVTCQQRGCDCGCDCHRGHC